MHVFSVVLDSKHYVVNFCCLDEHVDRTHQKSSIFNSLASSFGKVDGHDKLGDLVRDKIEGTDAAG